MECAWYRRKKKMAHIKELRAKAMRLPLHPGVYIMHSRDDTIIYIGKAKALKNRVSQYFGSDKNHNEKRCAAWSQMSSISVYSDGQRV